MSYSKIIKWMKYVNHRKTRFLFFRELFYLNHIHVHVFVLGLHVKVLPLSPEEDIRLWAIQCECQYPNSGPPQQICIFFQRCSIGQPWKTELFIKQKYMHIGKNWKWILTSCHIKDKWHTNQGFKEQCKSLSIGGAETVSVTSETREALLSEAWSAYRMIHRLGQFQFLQ